MQRMGKIQSLVRSRSGENSSCPGEAKQFTPFSEILLHFNPDGSISQRLLPPQDDFPIPPADRSMGRCPNSMSGNPDDEVPKILRAFHARRQMPRQMTMQRSGSNSVSHRMPVFAGQEHMTDQSMHWQRGLHSNAHEYETPPRSYRMAERRYSALPPTYHCGMRAQLFSQQQPDAPAAGHQKSAPEGSLNFSGPRNPFSPTDNNYLRTIRELDALCARRQREIEAAAASQGLLFKPSQSNSTPQDNSFLDMINLPDNTISNSFDVVIEKLERIIQSWDKSLGAGNREDPTDPEELSRVLAERLINKSQHLDTLKKEVESILLNLKRILSADSSFNKSKSNDLLATMQDLKQTQTKCPQCCSCGAPLKNTPESSP